MHVMPAILGITGLTPALDLGFGHRHLTPGGKLDREYKISVPGVFAYGA